MRDLSFDKQVHAGKLHAELVAAVGHESTGGKFIGVSTGPASPCIVHITDNATGGNETTIGNVVSSHDATPPATPIQTYANAFLANKKKIADVGMAFSEGFRLSDGSIGAFRLTISTTLAKIAALPVGFTTEFTNERTGYYATRYGAIPADDMVGATLAQCQTYYDFLAPWIARLMGMLGAALAGNLDNGI